MEGESLHLRLQRKEPDEMSVRLEGPLDRQTVPAIRKELLASVKGREIKEVEIDLSEVSSLDTAGIAVMVEVMRILSGKQGRLRLTGLSEHAIKVIHLSRLDALFGLDNRSAGRS